MEPDLWVADPVLDGDVAIVLRHRWREPVQQQKAKRQHRLHRLHRLQFRGSSPPMHRGTRQVTLSTVWAEAVSPGDAEEDSAAAAEAAAADVEEGDSGKGVILIEGRYCK